MLIQLVNATKMDLNHRPVTPMVTAIVRIISWARNVLNLRLDTTSFPNPKFVGVTGKVVKMTFVTRPQDIVTAFLTSKENNVTDVKLIILIFHLVNHVDVMQQEARTINVMMQVEIVTASSMSQDKNVIAVKVNFSAFPTAKVSFHCLAKYITLITFTNTFDRMSMLCPWNNAQHNLR